jgi:hypothetical protein
MCSGSCVYLVKKNPDTQKLKWVHVKGAGSGDNCQGDDCIPCDDGFMIKQLGPPKKGLFAKVPCCSSGTSKSPKPIRVRLPKGVPLIIETD